MKRKAPFENPILAGDWLPIARSIAHVIERLPLKTFAVADFMSFGIDEWGYSHPVSGPYLQVFHERDGRLTAEVGFGPTITAANPRASSSLTFLGFIPPTPGDPNHPNFSKIYAPGWRAHEVTKELISGIALSGLLTTEVGFSLQSPNRTQVSELGLVYWSNGLQMWVAGSASTALSA